MRRIKTFVAAALLVNLGVIHGQEQVPELTKETWPLQVQQRCTANSGTLFCPDLIPDITKTQTPLCPSLDVDPYLYVLVSGTLRGGKHGKFQVNDNQRTLASISVRLHDITILDNINPMLGSKVEIAIQKLGAKPELEGEFVQTGPMFRIPIGDEVGIDDLQFTTSDYCQIEGLRELLSLYHPSVRLVIRKKK